MEPRLPQPPASQIASARHIISLIKDLSIIHPRWADMAYCGDIRQSGVDAIRI